MGVFRKLSSRDKWEVLTDAKKILQKGRLSEAPGGQLRGAIVRALRQRGWHASGYGKERERSVTREVGRAIPLTAPAASDVEAWAKEKPDGEIINAIDRAIQHLQP